MFFNVFRSSKNYSVPELVSVEHTRRRGRPRKLISEEVIRGALERRMPLSALARTLKVDHKTLRTRMEELGLSPPEYTPIPDHELDAIISEFLASHPQAGRRFAMGHLRGNCQIHIPYRRLIASLSRVNKVRNELRKQATAQKSHPVYQVKRPHALWHIDGHHKLITWGIVIHGMVDGFSRKVNIT